MSLFKKINLSHVKGYEIIKGGLSLPLPKLPSSLIYINKKKTMEINKETKLKEIIPEGYEIDTYISETITPRIVIDLKKEPSKDELLKKAYEEYYKGVVFAGSFDDEVVCKIDPWWNDKHTWISVVGPGRGGVVYDNGRWAKIIKTPVQKMIDGFAYEDDTTWLIRKNDNWEIRSCEVGNSPFAFNEDSGNIRFVNKKSALDYVMEEAKRMFEGCNRYRFIDEKDKHRSFKSPLKLEFITHGLFHDGHLWWTEDKGFIAEPVKEDVVEWVVFTGKSYNTYTKNKLYKLLSKSDYWYTEFDEEGHTDNGILLGRARPATKPEIEAHKLGFHIGDTVITATVTDKIVSFSYNSFNLVAGFEDGTWQSVGTLNNQKLIKSGRINRSTIKEFHNSILGKIWEPKQELMLGEHPVIIKDGMIECKKDYAKKTEWLKWAKVFVPAAKAGSHIELELGPFKTICRDGLTECIEIGCIKNVTLKQIKKITKAIKKLTS
jgi:hypothetical protein